MDEKHACRLPIDVIVPYLKPLNPIPTRLQSKGGLKPPIRCLLCDLYGTLLISGSGDVGQDQLQPPPLERLSVLLKHYAISQSAEELLEALHEAIKREHIKAKERGIDYPEVQIETIWQQILPSKGREELVRFAIEFEMVFNPVWPMPHLPELLTSCRELDIPLGIISNAQFFTPPLFEWLAGAPLNQLGFSAELTFFSYRHGIAKPSDRLFCMATEQLKASGIDPRQTAYIGNDMLKDILPAHRQGFQTILFAGDARSLRIREEDPLIDTLGPDLIVTELNQVISWLQPND